MMSELVGLSIARVYPFGGLLRHQYVVGPFLILAAFVVIDRLASLVRRRARIALTAATALVLIGNMGLTTTKIVVGPTTIFAGFELKKQAT
jgi:hypothetical protein